MTAKKTIKFRHEKLGEITLNTNQNGRALYDKETTMGILLKGLEYLSDKGLLTTAQKSDVENQLQACNVEIIHKSGMLSRFNYQYNRLTGEAFLTSLQIEDNSQYLDNERMANGLLDLLCDIITTILHKERNLKNADKKFKLKEAEWENYATALLPEDVVISNRFYNKAIEYLTQEISEEQVEKLKVVREYNDIDAEDWIKLFANDYAEVVMDDLSDIGEEGSLSVKDYIDDQITIYEQDKDAE